jgi:hypothetical protein
VTLTLVELLSSEMGQQKTKMEMTIVAELYDSLQASCSFNVEFKVGEEVVGEWEWPARNYGGKFMRRVRFPFKLRYLN